MEKPTSLSFFKSPDDAALSLCRQNALLERYGLSLTQAQATALAEREQEVLRDNGRVEFGEGALPKLLYAFCDSPFISRDNLTETMDELLQTFYYYKNESDGLLSDDELVDGMAAFFNGPAQGSLEYMAETSLGELIRAMRRGFRSRGGEE